MSTYVVKQGDSLSSIAKSVLGDLNLWQYLASINNISSPYVIYPGQIIKVDVAAVETTEKKSYTWIWWIVAVIVLIAIYLNRKRLLSLIR
jgi:LysM repeat protein